MHTDFVISVMSLDSVGIVSALTEAVADEGGNIDAISQTVLRGYFTIILTVHFESPKEMGRLTEAIKSRRATGELEVSVKERTVLEPGPVVADAERFILTISGPDRPGIIHRVTTHLASRGINIEDLYAYVRADAFQLNAQLQVPAGSDVERLRMDVESLWPASEMRVTMQHTNIFLAVNQVDFRQSAS